MVWIRDSRGHLAKSLVALLAQVDAAFPHRSKDSDGSIGNDEHAVRPSDHNILNGIEHALDITHDPSGGFDSYAFAEMLRQRQDKRIRYAISNRRIFDGPGMDHPAWLWHPYTGLNPHDHHVHVSVSHDPKLADDEAPWNIGGMAVFADPAVKQHPPKPPATLRRGDKGDAVSELQRALKIFDDGKFGLGTEKAVKAFQASHGLFADGVVGPQSWKAIKAEKT